MLSRNHHLNSLSLLCLLSINILFLIKYVSRYTDYAILVAIFFSLLLMIIIFVVDQYVEKKLLIKTKWKNSALLLLSVLSVFLLSEIPFETRVSRLPAIMQWIENFSKGVFPYRSAANPSGFPFLYYLSMPFYLLGDVGYLAVFGLVLYLWLLVSNSNTKKELIVRILLLFSMLPVVYEIIVRSELFANMSIIILIFFLSEKYLIKNNFDIKFVFLSILWGLLLSTRLVAFLLFTLYVIYHFRNNILKGILFSCFAVFIFILTLVPFVLWDAGYFFSRGPFSIQFLYLPSWMIPVFCVMLVFAGWVIADIRELFFACGFFLFAAAFSSLITFCLQEGIEEVFRFDISYFIFCVPFFILSIQEYEIKRMIGKVIKTYD